MYGVLGMRSKFQSTGAYHVSQVVLYRFEELAVFKFNDLSWLLLWAAWTIQTEHARYVRLQIAKR